MLPCRFGNSCIVPLRASSYHQSWATAFNSRFATSKFSYSTHQVRKSTSSHAATSRAFQDLRAGTIVSGDPSVANADQILSLVQPPENTSNAAAKSNAVLLCSKHFAALATNEHFIRQFIYRMIGHQGVAPGNATIKAVDILTAVVDKIPNPNMHDLRSGQLERTGDQSLATETLSQEYEGVSFLFDIGGECLRLGRTAVEEPITNRKSIGFDKPGVLSVHMTGDVSPNGHEASLELPLANTLFNNGHRSTLLLSRWKMNTDNNTFDSVSSKLGSQGSIHLHRPQRSDGKSHDPAAFLEQVKQAAKRQDIYLPLQSITPARKVSESAGNIVRKLYDESGLPMGASHELEHSIAEHFAASGLDLQPITVWAIVIPAIVDELVNLHTVEPSQLMNLGASLHRVLSGGGGWGTKAGLISLDPYLSFLQSTTPKPLDFSKVEETTGLFEKEGLGTATARHGDFLRFYILDPALESNCQPKSATSSGSRQENVFQLGTCLNSEDSIENLSEEASKPGSILTKTFDGWFGGLSEMGIGLHRTLSSGGETSHFKIDVPGSRVTYRIKSAASLDAVHTNNFKHNPGSSKRHFHTISPNPKVSPHATKVANLLTAEPVSACTIRFNGRNTASYLKKPVLRLCQQPFSKLSCRTYQTSRPNQGKAPHRNEVWILPRSGGQNQKDIQRQMAESRERRLGSPISYFIDKPRGAGTPKHKISELNTKKSPVHVVDGSVTTSELFNKSTLAQESSRHSVVRKVIMAGDVIKKFQIGGKARRSAAQDHGIVRKVRFNRRVQSVLSKPLFPLASSRRREYKWNLSYARS